MLRTGLNVGSVRGVENVRQFCVDGVARCYKFPLIQQGDKLPLAWQLSRKTKDLIAGRIGPAATVISSTMSFSPALSSGIGALAEIR